MLVWFDRRATNVAGVPWQPSQRNSCTQSNQTAAGHALSLTQSVGQSVSQSVWGSQNQQDHCNACMSTRTTRHSAYLTDRRTRKQTSRQAGRQQGRQAGRQTETWWGSPSNSVKHVQAAKFLFLCGKTGDSVWHPVSQSVCLSVSQSVILYTRRLQYRFHSKIDIDIDDVTTGACKDSML